VVTASPVRATEGAARTGIRRAPGAVQIVNFAPG
jgi:hypothetical protein